MAGRDVAAEFMLADIACAAYTDSMDQIEKMMRRRAVHNRATIAKSLMRQYAEALHTGDIDQVRRISKALDRVTIEKATEWWNWMGGQTQRQVERDERGRFKRSLSTKQTGNKEPTEHKGRRKKGGYQAAPKAMSAFVQTPEGSPQRQRLQHRAREVARFQDELAELFGDSTDVRILIPAGKGKQVEQPIGEPINRRAMEALRDLEVGEDVDLEYELGPNAALSARRQMAATNALGAVAPQGVAQVIGQRAGYEAPGSIRETAQQYQAAQPGTPDRIQRGFQLTGQLGSLISNIPLTEAKVAGGALSGVSAAGAALTPAALKRIEETNYRARGKKRALPREFSEIQRSPAMADLHALYSMPAAQGQARWEGTPDAPGLRQYLLDQSAQVQASNLRGTPAHLMSALVESALMTSETPQEYASSIGREAAVVSLIRAIPYDKQAAELAVSAGKEPPSQGIIIRDDGQAKEMYQGVGPDTFLPFSGRSMSELPNGQYVRSRTLGGPTPEDLKALVVGGAKSATVVSASGVYTIHLNPDMSRAQLASPDVLAIGSNYERMLQQVQESRTYIKDISPMEKRQIERDAIDQGYAKGTKEFQAQVQQVTDQLRAEQADIGDDARQNATREANEEADDMVKRGFIQPSQHGQVAAELFAEKERALSADKVRKLQLNAEGYKYALDALALQYPQVIDRVTYESVPDFAKNRGLSPKYFEGAELALRNRRGTVDTQMRARLRGAAPAAAAEQPAGAETGEATPEAAAPAAATGTAAATTAPTEPAGTTAAAPKAGGGKERIENLRTKSLNRQIRVGADRLLASEDRPVFHDPQTPDPPSFTTTEEFKAVLGASGAQGMRARMDSGEKRPEVIFASDRFMEDAAKSPEGRTVLMQLAFGPTEGLYQRLAEPGGDPFDDDHIAQARRYLDIFSSAKLMQYGEVSDTPDAVGPYGLSFFVHPAFATAVPADIAAGKGDKALSQLEKRWASGTDINIRNAKKATKALRGEINTITSSPLGKLAAKALGQGVVWEDQERLGQAFSTLGLLALQSQALSDIDDEEWQKGAPDTPGARLIEAIEPDAYKDKARFDARKKKAHDAYATLIGYNYLHQLLGGGGGFAPKGLVGNVAKSLPRPLVKLPLVDRLGDLLLR